MGKQTQASSLAACEAWTSQCKAYRPAFVEAGRLMRVGLVIDELDPRRGGMAQWCWQFVASVAKLGYELHVVSQGFGSDAMPPRVTCHTVPRTKSRVAFAQAAAEIVRNLEL